MSAQGVRRMGSRAWTYCHAFNRCCRNAVSRGLSVSKSHSPRPPLGDPEVGNSNILAGRRLLTFFFLSLLGSWLEMESV